MYKTSSIIKLEETTLANDSQQQNHRLVEPYLNNLRINEFKLNLKLR